MLPLLPLFGPIPSHIRTVLTLSCPVPLSHKHTHTHTRVIIGWSQQIHSSLDWS